MVDEFVSACRAAGLGYGFYYTAVDNFYLNVRGGAVQDAAQLLSGQARVSEEDYGEVVLGHLKELWTRYGNLTEVWFDGGLGRFFAPVSDMLRSLQPEAAVFNGYNVSNCVRWVSQGGTDGVIGSRPSRLLAAADTSHCCWPWCHPITDADRHRVGAARVPHLVDGRWAGPGSPQLTRLVPRGLRHGTMTLPCCMWLGGSGGRGTLILLSKGVIVVPG